MVWDPARVAPRPWEAIVELYRQLEDRNDDFRPLRHLVAHVAGSDLAASIFGATSGTALLVARVPDADWVHDALRIDVDLGGAVRFVPPSRGAVTRTAFECASEKIVDTFVALLRDSGWIPP